MTPVRVGSNFPEDRLKGSLDWQFWYILSYVMHTMCGCSLHSKEHELNPCSGNSWFSRSSRRRQTDECQLLVFVWSTLGTVEMCIDSSLLLELNKGSMEVFLSPHPKIQYMNHAICLFKHMSQFFLHIHSCVAITPISFRTFLCPHQGNLF